MKTPTLDKYHKQGLAEEVWNAGNDRLQWGAHGESPNQQWWGYNGHILGYADIWGHSTGDNDESVQMGAIIHRGPVESLVFWRFLSTFCGIPRTELLGFALFEALFLFHFLVFILWFCLYDWVFVFFPPYYFRVTAHHLHHLAWSCARCNPGKLLRVAYLQPKSCHLSDGPFWRAACPCTRGSRQSWR